MAVTRREFLAALTAATATGALAACGGRQPSAAPAATSEPAAKVDLGEFKSLALDMKAWHHDAEHDVWWQVGLAYCAKPVTTTYEKLGIYVPGAYLRPADEKADLSSNDASKTYECKLDPNAAVGAFTCSTAPIVMPLNTPEFSAQTAPGAYLYDGLAPYLSAGLVYVYAGCRGRSNGYDSSSAGEGFFSGGAPWGVTDLKAAVRYLRYNAEVLPGSTDRIVAFGHAAGGLLAAVMGASGDSPLYADYLAKIGAATHDAKGNDVGDAISAAMCWCPEPSADSADAAYEWGLGQFGTDGTRAEGTWTKMLSEDLAASFAAYVNGLGLAADGQQLTLDQTDGGVFTDGTYYERLVSLVEGSAGKFLAETAFPHTFELVDQTSGLFPGSGVKPAEVDSAPSVDDVAAAAATASASTGQALASGGSGAATEPAATTSPSTAAATTAQTAAAAASPQTPVSVAGTTATKTVKSAPVTYASRADYIAALNAGGHWLTYNEEHGTARVSGVAGYVRACRSPLSDVLSFDTTQRSGALNQLFGNDDDDTLHFSQSVADLLSKNSGTYAQASGWDAKLPGDWAGDLSKTDSLQRQMGTRRAMYDPLYFVTGASEGFGTAKVAEHWRINVGMSQPTVPLTSSANLSLALKAYAGVSDVAYTPVWGVGRVPAEIGGADPTASFVQWVGTLYPAGQATTAQTEAQTQ